LIGLALVLIALLGFLSAYSHASKRTRILVAARDLPAGTLLHASDLASTSIAGDRTLLASLVGSGERSRVLGRRLATPLLAGAPLPRAAVVAPAQVPDSLTLAVPALHALAGGLVAGDRVTVLATFDNGAGHAQTRAVARGLEVLAVGRPPSTIDPSTATVPVTLALTQPALASTLALANNEGKLDLLREGSSNQTAPIPAAATPTR
jgi:Flp pilus assembly protein CpaB